MWKDQFEGEGLPVPASSVRHKRSLAALSAEAPEYDGPRDDDLQLPMPEPPDGFAPSAGMPASIQCKIGLTEVVDSARDDLLFLAEEDQPFDDDGTMEPSVRPPVGSGVMSARAMSTTTHQRFMELVTTLEKGQQMALDRRPQLRKIEAPRIYVPRQQPEIPRARHRLIFSWCTWPEWEATRQPPRNWQPLSRLPGPAEPLPEDMIRVLPKSRKLNMGTRTAGSSI